MYEIPIRQSKERMTLDKYVKRPADQAQTDEIRILRSQYCLIVASEVPDTRYLHRRIYGLLNLLASNLSASVEQSMLPKPLQVSVIRRVLRASVVTWYRNVDFAETCIVFNPCRDSVLADPVAKLR